MANPRERSLERLLRPRSIAVVGASADHTKMSGAILPMLREGGFAGQLFAVNPRHAELDGTPCYPSLSSIKQIVDHCIILVRQEKVQDVLQECIECQVGGASIFASGYGEVGDEGALRQNTLSKMHSHLSFLGPNCLGFANLLDGVIATNSPPLLRNLAPGDLALVSQSGGLAFGSIVYAASEHSLRFSYVVNTGNSVGVDMGDVVEFLFSDNRTRRIFLVVESDAVVAEVLERLDRIGLIKPIVLLKLGRGETGARAARSHTGAVTGDYNLIRDCAEQAGIICVDDIDDALNAIKVIGSGVNASDARAIGAASISGGNVTLFADLVDHSQADFATLSPETATNLRELLPDYGTVNNPIDITNFGLEQPAVHRQILETLLSDAGCRCLVVILTTMEDYRATCHMIVDIARRTAKRVLVVWNGGSYDGEAYDILIDSGVPVFRGSSAFVRALGAVIRADADMSAPVNRHTDLRTPLRPEAGQEPGVSTFLKESDSLELLATHGVPVAPWLRARHATLVETARSLGFPIAIKVNSADTHLSDQDGVFLNLRSIEDVEIVKRHLTHAAAADYLVVRFLHGEELFVSSFHHREFGLVLILGSGGRWVELLHDLSFLRLPASREAIAKALRSTLIGRALYDGARGAVGFEPAVEAIFAIANLALSAQSTIEQIEINPLIVGENHLGVVDAAISTRLDTRMDSRSDIARATLFSNE